MQDREYRLCVFWRSEYERETTRVTGAGAEARGIPISDRFLPVQSQ